MKGWVVSTKLLYWARKSWIKLKVRLILMETSLTKIDKMSSDERKELLRNFYEKVVLPQRIRLVHFRGITNQTAQVDSDGYIAQLVASIVTGIPGTNRHGKSINLKGDLSDGTEVKSTYRTEQKEKMEDAHINFGSMNKSKMREFLSHKRCIIVHTSYDQIGRYKVEILTLDLTNEKVIKAFEDFYLRSKAKRPQFQPRLYPDNKRDKLYNGASSFKAIGAKVLARVVEIEKGALIDIWTPEKPAEPNILLSITNQKSVAPQITLSSIKLKDLTLEERKDLAKEFFKKTIIDFRRAYLPFCKITSTTQNLGIANLSQHVVSIISGIEGNDSNARGSDLRDGSEIKQAMGQQGDALGTEDWPRLNLGRNISKIVGWPGLYAVRIDCPDNLLRLKVLKADIDLFRSQVRDYFCPTSMFKNSDNLQYHVNRDFEKDSFSGYDSKGDKRELKFYRLLGVRETKEGQAEEC